VPVTLERIGIINMSANLMNGQFTSTEAERTMSSWASVIESYTAVPQPFKNECQPLLESLHPFPHTIFAPVIPGFQRKASQHLICAVETAIYVWERIGSQITTTIYPLETVNMVEVGHILLYSWFAIRGVTSEGEPVSSTIPFNTVTTRYFEQFVNRIRPAVKGINAVEWEKEKDKFNYLKDASYKFMNYARKSLLPGEGIIQTVWQPKISQPILTLFGRSLYRTLSLAHLAVLTDQEVIFVGDDPRLIEARGEQHGAIWQYVRLRRIASVSVSEEAHGLLTLSLTLSPGSHRLEKRFAVSQKQVLIQFQHTLETLIAAA
jgi:hypothetical protein